jgi:hypothetical protein
MSREAHVRFSEGVGVRFPRATRLPEGLRRRAGGARLHRKVSGLLQRPETTSELGSADAGSGLLQCSAANPGCGITRGRIHL